MYFEDLCEEDQERVIDYVIEMIKEEEPDYVEQAKECNMSVEDWLLEEADDYINRHNNELEIRDMLIASMFPGKEPDEWDF